MRFLTVVVAALGVMLCSCGDDSTGESQNQSTDYAAMFDGLDEPTQANPYVIARPLAGDTFFVGDTMEVVFKRLQPVWSCCAITLWEEYSGTIAYTLDGHTFADPNSLGIDSVAYEQHGDIDVVKWVVTDSVVNVQIGGPGRVPTQTAGGWSLTVGGNFLDCAGASDTVAVVYIK